MRSAPGSGTLAFAGQDYCDFAGYSTCAMGIGFCLGFVLPPNFHAPLASIGFRDVWQRWHITLVAWMRDYVFNPLGGVYKGYMRAAVNVMIVMLLIGLWHGATATFLIFGFLHGTFLIVEAILQRTSLRRLQVWRQLHGKVALWAITVGLCLIAFVFYRASNISQSRLPDRIDVWHSIYVEPVSPVRRRLADSGGCHGILDYRPLSVPHDLFGIPGPASPLVERVHQSCIDAGGHHA